MEEQIRYVFETNNIGVKDGNLNVDDVIETANHFRLVSLIITMQSLCLPKNLSRVFICFLKVEQVIQEGGQL